MADPSWQDIRPVLRPVQTHRLVAQVQHGAVPQQHSVGRTCQHDAAGARGSCDRGDDQLSGAGEDLPTHVVDGNDVVPGLAGWVLHRLDDTQWMPVSVWSDAASVSSLGSAPDASGQEARGARAWNVCPTESLARRSNSPPTTMQTISEAAAAKT